MTHRDPEPRWTRVTLTRTGPPAPVPWHRRRKVRTVFWVILLGSAASGAIGATLAAIGGTVTAPWKVAVLAWYLLIWVIIGALGSDDARRP